MTAHALNWRKIDLGDFYESSKNLCDVVRLASTVMDSTHDHSEVAIFVRLENHSTLHCVSIAYLSPALAQSREFETASPCAVPLRKGLSLVFGSESAWLLLDEEEAFKG